MADLSYAAPDSVEAAVALLAEAGGGARVLAGGTDVLVLLHGEIIEPELIVDIKNIPELRSPTGLGAGGSWFGTRRKGAN